MGLTHLNVTVASPARTTRQVGLTFLVDSGTAYSVLPKSVLHKLGIKAHSTQSFTLADGSQIRRRIGDAVFKLNSARASSPVIFGEKGDSVLLGSISLEAMGLMLDPIKRELRPLPMVL